MLLQQVLAHLNLKGFTFLYALHMCLLDKLSVLNNQWYFTLTNKCFSCVPLTWKEKASGVTVFRSQQNVKLQVLYM